jgi:hypothetical protein
VLSELAPKWFFFRLASLDGNRLRLQKDYLVITFENDLLKGSI